MNETTIIKGARRAISLIRKYIRSFIDEECVDEKCAVIDTHICVNPSGKLVSDQGSQTIYSKYELSKYETSLQLQDTTIPIQTMTIT